MVHKDGNRGHRVKSTPGAASVERHPNVHFFPDERRNALSTGLESRRPECPDRSWVGATSFLLETCHCARSAAPASVAPVECRGPWIAIAQLGKNAPRALFGALSPMVPGQ